MKQLFKVNGMSCSACSASVERVVKRLPSVVRADVNLISATLICEYDPTRLSENDIIAAVEKAGFEAVPETKQDKQKNSDSPSNVATEGKSSGLPSEKNRLIISLCFLLPLMYMSMGRMIGAPLPDVISPAYPVLFALTQMLLALPVLIVNRKFYINGVKALFRKSPNMDTLVATGSGAAFVFGVFSIYMLGVAEHGGDTQMVERYVGNLYFESSAMILTLITVGKAAEAKSKKRTGAAIEALKKLAPTTATVIRDGVETQVEIAAVTAGDVVVVRSGESVPVDGVLVEGEGYLDQSSLTGESMPAYKGVGDVVYAATILTDGFVHVRATAVGGETTLSKIIDMIGEAGATKAPIAGMADRISGIFVPVVMGIAAVTFVVWLIMGKPFEFALSNAISVLVISCPCALGLATPVAITVAIGAAAKRGILIRSADVFERIASVRSVVFDKTGTLTVGAPQVTAVVGNEEDELLRIAYLLESRSSHPVARAVTEYITREYTGEAVSFATIAGKGVTGVVDGERCYAGNLRYMTECGVDTKEFLAEAKERETKGNTVIWIAVGDRALGVIAVADVVRESSARTVERLRSRGLTTAMLTGDNASVGESVKGALGIDYAYCSLMPEDKSDIIRQTMEGGTGVVFVGDGINDSPAMATADVGIAVGSGTDVAIDSADIVLLKDGIADLDACFDISRSTIRNIKQNLFWAFIYNVVCIPIATGFLGISLSPMIAAAAMSASSIFVVTNALRLNRLSKGKNKTA